MNYKNYLKKLPALFILATFTITQVNAHEGTHNVRITEAMSSSGGVISDWFELTNLDSVAVDITGWKMDDSTFEIQMAVPLMGVTTIAPGQSVVFLEVHDGFTDTDTLNFRQFWGPNAASMVLGYYSGVDVSLSSQEDAIVIYDELGAEVTRVTFGAASVGKSFYWSYNNEGVPREHGVSVAGTIEGSTAHQFTFVSAHELGAIASPGTAIVHSLLSGLGGNYASDLKVSPNPFNDRIYLDGTDPVKAVSITNIIGQRFAYDNAATERVIQTGNLPNGVYLLTVEFANGKKQGFKLVKR